MDSSPACSISHRLAVHQHLYTTILTNGSSINVGNHQATSSVADEDGNLLFYSKGDTVFDRTHQIMANGATVFGKIGCLSIKKPGSDSLFYFITNGTPILGNGNQVFYSIIDMALATGMGSVTAKNTLLTQDSCFPYTAVRHCNGVDVWIVFKLLKLPEFRSYLLTSAGLTQTFVTSTFGSYDHRFSSLIANPSENKILAGVASLDPLQGTYSLFDFDKSTGLITNSVSLGSFGDTGWGAFSPDGSKLYANQWAGNKLYQWDMCAGSSSAIAASMYTVHTGVNFQKGNLQLAPNEKIYMARNAQNSLGVINSPNLSGASCNYVDQGQSIAPKLSSVDLPRFINSMIKYQPFAAINSQTMSCLTTSFTSSPLPSPTLCAATGYSITGILWMFGDPTSGASNTSTLTNPVHKFSGPGTYNVKQVIYNSTCAPDTLRKTVVVNGPAPNLILSSSPTICPGMSVSLVANGAHTYSWYAPAAQSPVTGSVFIATPSVTTSYTVIGNDTTGNCSELKTTLVVVNFCNGVVSSTTRDNTFKVFPNPSDGVYMVKSSVSDKISFLTPTGQILTQLHITRGLNFINVGYLPVGIYYIRNSKGTINYRVVKTE